VWSTHTLTHTHTHIYIYITQLVEDSNLEIAFLHMRGQVTCNPLPYFCIGGAFGTGMLVSYITESVFSIRYIAYKSHVIVTGSELSTL